MEVEEPTTRSMSDLVKTSTLNPSGMWSSPFISGSLTIIRWNWENTGLHSFMNGSRSELIAAITMSTSLSLMLVLDIFKQALREQETTKLVWPCLIKGPLPSKCYTMCSHNNTQSQNLSEHPAIDT